MKKIVSTLIIVTVFVINNFLMTSQAQASLLKNASTIGMVLLSKGAPAYSQHKKNEEKKKNNNKNYAKWEKSLQY